MGDKLTLYKGRDNVLSVGFGFDLSLDELTCELRTAPNRSATLLGAWDIDPVTDGSDGEYIFTYTKAKSDLITVTKAYMDIKRTSGGLELPAVADFIIVEIEEVVTT